MNGIPDKVNMMNVYYDGTRLLGLSGEITLPKLEALKETISGPGVLGEIESPTPGHFSSTKLEIPFRTLDEDMFDMIKSLSVVPLTMRASQQYLSSTEGIQCKQLRIVVRGIFASLDGGTLKQASPTNSSLELELLYYMIEIDRKRRIELDKLNEVFKINGVDVLEKARAFC